MKLDNEAYSLLRRAAQATKGLLDIRFSEDGSEPTITHEDGVIETWNPLVSDVQAIRLSAVLRIVIEHVKTLAPGTQGVNCYPAGKGYCTVLKLAENNLGITPKCIREAIVGSAALVGDTLA